MSRTPSHAAALPWYRTLSPEQWRVLAAAKLGWMLDALDFMLYTMALNQLRSYFMFGDAMAGFLGTATLVMSGGGGLIFGWVADRFGRTRALMGTIAVFSFASLGAATSQSVLQLLFWRTVLVTVAFVVLALVGYYVYLDRDVTTQFEGRRWTVDLPLFDDALGER